MIRQVELKMLRKNLKVFILAQPSSIALIRRTKTKTAAGGYVLSDPVTLPDQVFRIVQFKRRLTLEQIVTPAAEARVGLYTLVGFPDADIEQGDYFNHEGQQYLVEFISPDRSIKTTAQITHRNATDN